MPTQKQLQERFEATKRANYRESLRLEGVDTSERKTKSGFIFHPRFLIQ
jgi:hypothetical protein